MINNNLNVAIVEFDLAWSDKEANMNIVKEAIAKLPESTDLLILPEMFSTGFITESHERALSLAERNTQDTISQLHYLADKHSLAITGSFLARTASQLYNRAFFIEPGGDETFYDKRHLFRMGGETEIYNPGVTFAPVVRFRGWNIKIIVCYDLRFPAWCRNHFDKNAYDIMVVVASWPKARRNAWSTLLSARAMENESYVCGSNRRGIDPAGVDYASDSSATYDFKGNIMPAQNIPISNGNILLYSIERQALNVFRQKFPAWKDADDFEIKI